MEDKRKQDLEDEMNRFEQEIAGNLPPPPKLPGPHSMGMAGPSGFSQSRGNFLRPPVRGMPFPGPPPMPPPPMFGQTMDMMPGMSTMPGMPTMDGMHPMPPIPPPGLPVLPPMMGMAPPMMGMQPPMAPGPSNPTKSINKPSGKIAPPTVPLKNYEVAQEVEVEPAEEPEAANVEVKEPNKQRKAKKKTVLRVAGGVVWEDETLLEWEVNDFRIFVGDLGNEVSDDALLRAFSRYPSLLKAKVVRDKKTKKTKGFGFVSFKDPQDYLKAMREMNGKYVGNRPIKLRKSTWKERNINLAKKKEKEKKKLGLR